MDCSMPGFPVLHYLPKFAQTQVHWVGDAMQSSHLLLSPSPSAFNLSQHQGLFQWVNSASGDQSIGASVSASVLPINIQNWSPLGFTGLISLQSKGLSSLFQHHSSKALIIQCSTFFMVQLSYLYMTTEKPITLTIWTTVKNIYLKAHFFPSRLIITHSWFLPR